MAKESFIDGALEEGICARCDRQIMAGIAGGFQIKVDRVLLSKFEELELKLAGTETFQLETRPKGIFAKYRTINEIRSSINKTQPLVVGTHKCKESELVDATIPF